MAVIFTFFIFHATKSIIYHTYIMKAIKRGLSKDIWRGIIMKNTTKKLFSILLAALILVSFVVELNLLTIAIAIVLTLMMGSANSPLAASIAMVVPFIVMPIVSCFTKKVDDEKSLF